MPRRQKSSGLAEIGRVGRAVPKNALASSQDEKGSFIWRRQWDGVCMETKQLVGVSRATIILPEKRRRTKEGADMGNPPGDVGDASNLALATCSSFRARAQSARRRPVRPSTASREERRLSDRIGQILLPRKSGTDREERETGD